jgi:hypothetical protein
VIGWNLPRWLENAESKASSSLEKSDRAGEKQLEEHSTRYDWLFDSIFNLLRLAHINRRAQ